MTELELVAPTKEYEAQVMALRQTFFDNNEGFNGCAGLEYTDSYDDWLDFENRLKRAYGETYIPSSVFLSVRKSDNKVVGIIDVRHQLNDVMLKWGGQIGCSVLPDERRKGYATEMLRLALEKCRELNLTKVLICCDKENIASAKTIVANGGVLENEVPDEMNLGKSGVMQRYWIEIL